MLSALLKWGKKILMILIIGFLISTNIGYAKSNEYIKWTVGDTVQVSQIQQREYDIIIRPRRMDY